MTKISLRIQPLQRFELQVALQAPWARVALLEAQQSETTEVEVQVRAILPIHCCCGFFSHKREGCCAGGMSGGIEGGTAGKSGQERKDVAGTGAGSGNSSADTAGRQLEGASGQGLSGQGGVF